MVQQQSLQETQSELAKGMALPKCRQCGCMAEALDNLSAALATFDSLDALSLAEKASTWRREMRPLKYSCLGCEICFPAVAQNAFGEAFPDAAFSIDLSCDFRLMDAGWPPAVGEYAVLDETAPVAVSTLASAQLADELAQLRPRGLAIIGKTETENIGIDKVIKNVISNASLQVLVIAGAESAGHFVGQTFLALAKNGVDEKGRVIASPGKRPILRNVSALEIEAFRSQVQVIDMIGQEDAAQIAARIEELGTQTSLTCGCSSCGPALPLTIAAAPKINAGERSDAVKLDKAGYFVILPLSDSGTIHVEHYTYDNELLRIIDGASAREIYQTIISSGWVTELSHAAYLGKELAKAELSLQHGFRYCQDGA